MTQKESQLKNLQLLLQELDANLLQRATDYIRGLIDASNQQSLDWWEQLPDSVKNDHKQGVREAEEGKVILLEDFLKKYNR